MDASRRDGFESVTSKFKSDAGIPFELVFPSLWGASLGTYIANRTKAKRLHSRDSFSFRRRSYEMRAHIAAFSQ